MVLAKYQIISHISTITGLMGWVDLRTTLKALLLACRNSLFWSLAIGGFSFGEHGTWPTFRIQMVLSCTAEKHRKSHEKPLHYWEHRPWKLECDQHHPEEQEGGWGTARISRSILWTLVLSTFLPLSWLFPGGSVKSVSVCLKGAAKVSGKVELYRNEPNIV